MTARVGVQRVDPAVVAVSGEFVLVPLRLAARWAPALRTLALDYRDRGQPLRADEQAVVAAFNAAEAALRDVSGPSPEPTRPVMLSCREVARRCGLSEQAVRKATREGRLVGQRYGRGWLFEEVDVERWRARRGGFVDETDARHGSRRTAGSAA